MSLPEPPGHVKHVQMSRSAPPDGTCLHLLKPAGISRPPRDVPLLAQTSSDHLSLAQMLSDSSAASRKHVNNTNDSPDLWSYGVLESQPF